MNLRSGRRGIARVGAHGTGVGVGLRMLHQAGALFAGQRHTHGAVAERAGWRAAVRVFVIVGGGAHRLLLHGSVIAIRIVGRAVGLVLVEVVHIVGILTAVTNVLLAATDAAEEPADTASKGFDKVPNVHGVPNGSKAHETTLFVLKLVGNSSGVALLQIRTRVVARCGAALRVRLVWKSPEMEQSKGGHFDAEKQGRDADLDIGIGEDLVRVHNVQGRGSNGNGRGLPEGEEDNELDGDNLDEKLLLLEGVLELDVDLDEAEHGNGDGDGIEDDDPDVSKDRAVGAFAVLFKVLGNDSRNGHGDTDKAVVVDTNPVNIEPGQAALRRAPWPALAAAALGEPADGHDPGFDGTHLAEELLLGVQIRGDIVAEQSKEGSNGKGLVAVGNNLKVDGVSVPLNLEEG